jgi:hypothetical protein
MKIFIYVCYVLKVRIFFFLFFLYNEKAKSESINLEDNIIEQLCLFSVTLTSRISLLLKKREKGFQGDFNHLLVVDASLLAAAFASSV